jgi:hypothetical protein
VSKTLLAHSSVLNLCKRLVARGTALDVLDFLEGNSGYEALGLPGLGYLAVELVDLLQSESLGLVDTKVYEHATNLESELAEFCGLELVVMLRTQQKPAQIQKTLVWIALVRYGVEYAMAQLRSQLEAVVIERDLALTFKGKISPVTTQAQGPHEHAKKKI